MILYILSKKNLYLINLILSQRINGGGTVPPTLERVGLPNAHAGDCGPETSLLS